MLINQKIYMRLPGAGMVIDGLITGAIAASAGPCYVAQCMNTRTDLLESGMQGGAVVGRIRYSPELEADRLATHIVREAGYDLRAARKLFIIQHLEA